ncbi:Cytochrome [Forsythia ovata]|uniref:Cytochrome n=1 Tax=Forsythia ovata TaxID=205694 RepID=A0ABD1TQY1_9LAMI
MISSLLLCVTLGFILFSSSLKFKKFTPPSCPAIGCLISFYKNRHRLLDWYTQLLSESKTQTIVVQRFGAPRTVVTANPNNVEYILKTNFENFPKGKPFTDLLGDFLGVGIFNVDGEKWSLQRKLASHEFSAKSLREFVVKILEDEVENRLLPVLENAAENNIILDMQEVLRRFAFDTICEVSLGTNPSCLDLSRPVPPLVEAFDGASKFSAMRGVEPVSAVWKCKRALNLGSEKKLKESVNFIHSSVNEIIQAKKRKLEKGGGNDLLSRFLGAGLDDEMVRDMVISFLMAGRDTTSAALTWLFWLLSGHPDIEKHVVDEAFSINGEKSLNFDDLKEMKYIKACLCESMRLYPPVVWDSKHAAKDDILPDGTPVYKGNRVTYFQYGMGRMEELWGKDRFEFRPDRWFDETGVLKSVSPFKFPVFQAGLRVCLGKEMAFIQMKYVVASVLRRFEFVPENLDRPIFVPLLTAYMAGGFNVRVRRRRDLKRGRLIYNMVIFRRVSALIAIVTGEEVVQILKDFQYTWHWRPMNRHSRSNLTVLKRNLKLYGRDFNGGKPTGRVSNGRIPTDFIFEAFEVKEIVPAYLDPAYNITDFATIVKEKRRLHNEQSSKEINTLAGGVGDKFSWKSLKSGKLTLLCHRENDRMD